MNGLMEPGGHPDMGGIDRVALGVTAALVGVMFFLLGIFVPSVALWMFVITFIGCVVVRWRWCARRMTVTPPMTTEDDANYDRWRRGAL